MKFISFLSLFLWTSLSVASPELDEAKALLHTMNAKEQYKVVAIQAKEQLDLNSEQMLQFSDKIYEEMARIYSEVYTQEELEAIRQFYESSAGQAFLNKKPLLTEKYMSVINQLASDFVD
ncbi:MAG: hypothetical protein Altm2KO_36060 [Alteromonas macleodii]|jgi:hypothetical protein|uniref:DUF2059 domain-containing protein n=1 Tax=Alteromonas TaxID=226 RepID=UPI000286DC11|nr:MULTISPECIES: DUF2059 domain-containing protein [Alteromonas]AFT95633.1 hypothetical protein AMBAS45_10810 [Alteromonas macleodii str. 'Balearic Sea AD45']MDK2764533.1 DUF2059 domain-containing protein [Alteromonas macleodii]NOH60248.1 DUF2059 domain-containing protein [Alteromonas sp. 07-89-2]